MTVTPEKPRTPASRVIARTARAPGQAAADPNAWLVPASAEDDPPGANAKYGPLPADRRGFSILSRSGRSSDKATAGQALSPGAVWPRSMDLIIQNPQTGVARRVHPVDIGAGSDKILPVIGLYPQTREDLGLKGGAFKVVIARADGGGLKPARGTRITAGFSITNTGTVTTVEPYEFTRGDGGQAENSYDCAGRLADEVGWSRWVQQNTLFFASDDELRAGAAALEITGDEPWLLTDPAWEWSPNRPTNTITLRVLADRWGVQIGAGVVINMGRPIDGRYLVSETHGSWVNPELQVVLERPAPKQLEPAPQTSTETAATVFGSSGVSTASGVSLVDVCRQISSQNRGYLYGGGHGKPLSKITAREPLDCSSSCSLALWAAGMFPGSRAITSGEFASSWGQAGKGRDFTVWANGGHVWIEFYGVAGISRFDTRALGSGGSGPHVRSTPATDQAQFKPRHW